MGTRLLPPALVLVLLLLGSVHAEAQALSLSVGRADQGWPVRVEIGDVLGDPGLQGALASALPLRFHLRVELWRKGTFDRLEDREEISAAILQDPLGAGYWIETPSSEYRVQSLEAAQSVLRGLLAPSLRPRHRGRHYYLATLEIETLSLTDLEELRRWLRGDVAPAIEGRATAGRAVERGLRRILVRVIGLPTRRFEARTGTFDTG